MALRFATVTTTRGRLSAASLHDISESRYSEMAHSIKGLKGCWLLCGHCLLILNIS